MPTSPAPNEIQVAEPTQKPTQNKIDVKQYNQRPTLLPPMMPPTRGINYLTQNTTPKRSRNPPEPTYQLRPATTKPVPEKTRPNTSIDHRPNLPLKPTIPPIPGFNYKPINNIPQPPDPPHPQNQPPTLEKMITSMSRAISALQSKD